MSLILDHVNGISNDHRLENLRIVCPNCAATLDTHCGKQLRKPPLIRCCAGCNSDFDAKRPEQRFCSRECGQRAGSFGGLAGMPRPHTRRVERPPYGQLLRELEETSFLAVGRKYGVSDNAIRKWVRQYERESKRDPDSGGTVAGARAGRSFVACLPTSA